MDEIKNITLDKVVGRLQVLDTVVSHQFEEIGNDNPTKVNAQFFTAGEKICINQERASLRTIKNYWNNAMNTSVDDIVFYRVSEGIEKKIQSCLKHIATTGWQRNINHINVYE